MHLYQIGKRFCYGFLAFGQLDPHWKENHLADLGPLEHQKMWKLRVLREMFPGHLISLRGDVGWPARSPDLNPCDFFLWGYLKEKVFIRPRSLEDLKERIRQEIDAIPPEITRTVMKNFRERLQQCVANDGRHMSDKIFKNPLKSCFLCTFQKYIQFFSR